jgi:hypothetical protein
VYGLPSPSSDSMSHVKTALLITTSISSQQNDHNIDNNHNNDNLLPLASSLLSTSSSASSALAALPINNANLAQAHEFNEIVTLGAISKAGGLPHTSEVEKSYIKFAEKKILRDNSLDHYSVLWELGTGITEQKYLLQNLENEEEGVTNNENIEKNENNTMTTDKNPVGMGFDKQNEDKLISNMKEWFMTNGGTLKYVEPVFDPYTKYYRLQATESILADESVVSVPFKLIMCRQTARNVLIKHKSKSVKIDDKQADRQID